MFFCAGLFFLTESVTDCDVLNNTLNNNAHIIESVDYIDIIFGNCTSMKNWFLYYANSYKKNTNFKNSSK